MTKLKKQSPDLNETSKEEQNSSKYHPKNSEQHEEKSSKPTPAQAKIFRGYRLQRQMEYPEFWDLAEKKCQNILQSLQDDINKQYIAQLYTCRHFSTQVKGFCETWFVNEKNIELKETALNSFNEHVKDEEALSIIFEGYDEELRTELRKQIGSRLHNFYECSFEDKTSLIKKVQILAKEKEVQEEQKQLQVAFMLKELKKAVQDELITEKEFKNFQEFFKAKKTLKDLDTNISQVKVAIQQRQVKAQEKAKLEKANTEKTQKEAEKELQDNKRKIQALTQIKNLGQLYILQNEKTKAVEKFTEALKLNPQDLELKNKIEKIKDEIKEDTALEKNLQEQAKISEILNHTLKTDKEVSRQQENLNLTKTAIDLAKIIEIKKAVNQAPKIDSENDIQEKKAQEKKHDEKIVLGLSENKIDSKTLPPTKIAETLEKLATTKTANDTNFAIKNAQGKKINTGIAHLILMKQKAKFEQTVGKKVEERLPISQPKSRNKFWEIIQNKLAKS